MNKVISGTLDRERERDGGGVNGYDINGGPSSFFYLNGVQMFEKRRTRRHTYYPYIETRTFSLSF
jgi:hypothetical protein